MSSSQPTGPRPSNNTGKVIITVVIVLVIVCIVIPVCVIATLAIMGPQIGNIFSRITGGVGSPMNWAGFMKSLSGMICISWG